MVALIAFRNRKHQTPLPFNFQLNKSSLGDILSNHSLAINPQPSSPCSDFSSLNKSFRVPCRFRVHGTWISDCLFSWWHPMGTLYPNYELLKYTSQSWNNFFREGMSSVHSPVNGADASLDREVLFLKEAYDCNNILIGRSYWWFLWGL